MREAHCEASPFLSGGCAFCSRVFGPLRGGAERRGTRRRVARKFFAPFLLVKTERLSEAVGGPTRS